jgi:Phosphodiester glycosidase
MSNSSSASLKVMSAHNVTGGGLETDRSMCARTPGCVAAVNGDFWDVAHPNAAVLGGLVLRREMWKSPNRTGQQASVAPPKLGLTWSGELTDKAGTTIKLAGVNTAPVRNATVLYTPRYGQAIGAVGSTSFKAAAPAQLLGRLARKTPLSGLRAGAGGTRVRAGQAGLVASGAAATALRQLFRAGGVTLTLSTSEPTTESIGYHPAIMRDGRLTRTDPHDPMLTNANPRTLVAWSPTKTWLVAADGRKRGGPGLTVGEVVALVRDLGAPNAVMLDGGGSTAFDAAYIGDLEVLGVNTRAPPAAGVESCRSLRTGRAQRRWELGPAGDISLGLLWPVGTLKLSAEASQHLALLRRHGAEAQHAA